MKTAIVRRKASKGEAVKVSSQRSSVTGAFLHREMTSFATNLAKDPEAARGFLQRAGIVTRTGKIAKAYGG